MPIFPVRDLGQKGILATPRRISFDLNAWSNGKGVRFHANKVQSGSIFRAAQDAQRRARILRRLTSPVGAWMPSSIGKDGYFGGSDGRWSLNRACYSDPG